jgi:predicted ATPase
LIAGRYRVEREAGAGGMGTVYEAIDTQTGQRVALKTWRAERERVAAPARLWREARALAEVRDPAVVRYVDHGVSASHGPFLVMAWVAGETLAERLRTRGVAPAQALQLCARLASGLNALHARAVVHRDLKPSNVMLPGGEVGQAMIVDLGVARLIEVASMTTSGGQIGTPRYMAPEQVRNARAVDGRADVFALGCILFECLTGRLLFEGSDPVTVIASILFEPLPAPSALRRELPAQLDTLVAALLERDSLARADSGAALELLAAAERSIDPGLLRELAATPLSGTASSAASLDAITHDADESSAELRPSFEVGINAVAMAVERAFPPQSGVFVGRELECQKLAALLRAGTRVLAVWGAPGLGKTRLVIEVVRQAAAEDLGRSWDALVFADLRDARDADDLVRTLAREAGVSAAQSPAPELALGQALAKLGRVLLVLDAIDHVAAPLAATLRALRRLTSGLQVVVTSRARFSPEGASVIELAPLATEADAKAGSGALSPAARLLLERAAPLLPALERARQGLDPERAAQAERLAAALEGIPLAIELYAARVHVLGLDGLLARTQASERESPQLALTRGTMRSALAWSFGLLSVAEQSAFAQCAVFRAGFTLDAAEAVVRVPGSPEPVWALIQALRDKSLVHSVAGDATHEPRLSMFAAVREFAWEELSASRDVAGVQSRHARYYAALDADPGSSPEPERLARSEREADNLLAAVEFALAEGGHELAFGLRALIALEPALLARGALAGYRAQLDQALQASERNGDDPDTRAAANRLRQIRARLEAPRGGALRARADLEHCLADAQQRKEAQLEATIWLDLGVCHHLEHALPNARSCYEAALALLSRSEVAASQALVEGRCLGNLGALLHDEGALVAAARFYERAIALLEQTGECRHRANLIGNLAVLEQELGQVELAAWYYNAALELLEPLRDARLLAITLGNLGVLELERGARDRALLLHERSRLLLADSGDQRSLSLCLGRLAATLALLDRVGEAEVRLARAERLARGDDPLLEAAVALGHAFIELATARRALASGRRAEAQHSFELASTRVAATLRTPSYGPGVRERSDDIRSSLRVLEPLLAALEQSLAAA